MVAIFQWVDKIFWLYRIIDFNRAAENLKLYENCLQIIFLFIHGECFWEYSINTCLVTDPIGLVFVTGTKMMIARSDFTIWSLNLASMYIL